jgi:hypothetical protein
VVRSSRKAFVSILGGSLVSAAVGCARIGGKDDIDPPPICNDPKECPQGSCWGDASNVDFLDESPVYTTAVDLNCNAVINTTAAPDLMLETWCGPKPLPVVQTQTDGGPIVVVPMSSFTLQAGFTLRLIGNKPVSLAVRGPAIINGIIDAGASATIPGAGGDAATDGPLASGIAGDDCPAQGSGQGRTSGELGGGGAGFRSNGGFGGAERRYVLAYGNISGYECSPACPQGPDDSFGELDDQFYSNNGATNAVIPIAGLASTDQDLRPLRAGCAGGIGSAGNFGGSGGGAVQISAATTLTVGSTAIISAAGGGGRQGPSGEEGGSGGGSGGGILLEASSVVIDPSAGLRAHGGAGSGRGDTCPNSIASDGHRNDNANASHVTSGCGGGGRGGLSYWDPTISGCDGSDPDQAVCLMPLLSWPTPSFAYPEGGNVSDNDGGGGGGGAPGVIVVRTLSDAGTCPAE